MNKRETFAAQLAPESFDESDGSVGLIAYTGSTVDRYDPWTGESYTMALDMDPAACDLSMLQTGTAPFVDNHDDSDTDQVLGVILPDSAAIVDGKLQLRAKLSVDPAHAGKVANIKAGVLRALSVGTDLLKVEDTKATKGKLRHVQVKLWRPYHVALVGRGADPNAQTFSQPRLPVDAAPPQQEKPQMDEAQLAELKAATAAEAVKTERTRIADIDRAALAVKADPALVAKLKAEGVPTDEARRQLLDVAASAQEKQGLKPQVSLVTDAWETTRDLVQHALLAKANPANKKFATEKAGHFRARRVSDMCRAMLSAQGIDSERWDDRKVIKRALFTHSTSDLPDLLGDSIGKVLLDTVAGGEAQYLAFAKQVKTPGLHARKPVILSGVSAVKAMAEGAPYPKATLSDTAESYSVAKSGEVVDVTIESLLRDDLGALGDIAVSQGQSLIDYRNQVVADLFAEGSGYGPTLAADSVALFNSAHANLVDTGSGGAFTVARAAALAALLAGQTDAQGNKRPRKGQIIVVPTALGHIANALLTGNYLQTSGSTETLTADIKALQLVTFDWLASATKWFLFADPMRSPVLEVATPDGIDDVWAWTEDERSGGDVRSYGVGQYFGARMVDYRGVAMNFGA